MYEADIDILPVSPYTYNDDIKIYKENATLGVGKLDYLIASGIKQKNIKDQLDLEAFLKLDEITPMQTSYTQTAVDREVQDENDKSSNQDKDEQKPSEVDESSSQSGIEPTDQEEPSNNNEGEDSSK